MRSRAERGNEESSGAVFLIFAYVSLGYRELQTLKFETTKSTKMTNNFFAYFALFVVSKSICFGFYRL